MTEVETKTDHPQLESHQFSVRSILVITTFVAAMLALMLDSGDLGNSVAAMVIAINLLGWVAGLFITHGLGFPRDGGYRHGEDND